MQTKQFSHVLTIGCFVIRKLLAEPSGNQIELSQLQKPIPLLSKKFYIFTDGSHTHAQSFTHNLVTHNLSPRNFVTHNLSHTTLSHAIFRTHHRSHTQSITHNLSHNLSQATLSQTIFHTQLCHTHICHTQLCHTQLCHTPTIFHTQSSSDTRTHTHSFTHTNLNTQTSTHTQRFHTHNYFTQTSPQSSFHATLSHTHTHTSLSRTNLNARTSTHNFFTHTPFYTQPFTHKLFHTRFFHIQHCHTHNLSLSHAALSRNSFTHSSITHSSITHTIFHIVCLPPPPISSRLPIPFSHLFWVCWKKWTCGIIRSFNFLWRHLHQFCEWILVMSHGWWVSYFMFNRESWFVLQPKWIVPKVMCFAAGKCPDLVQYRWVCEADVMVTTICFLASVAVSIWFAGRCRGFLSDPGHGLDFYAWNAGFIQEWEEEITQAVDGGLQLFTVDVGLAVFDLLTDQPFSTWLAS